MIRALLLSFLISQVPHKTVYMELTVEEVMLLRDALNYYYKHEARECGEINLPEVVRTSRLLKRFDSYLEPQECKCEKND